MKKLMLDCEALVVESFTTTREMREGDGTVRAHGMDAISGVTCTTPLTCTLGTKPTRCPCTPRDGEF